MRSSVSVSAILFTDIEGSSRLWEQEPARISKAIAQHDTLLRAAVESCKGWVVKASGDGLHAAFDDPLDALNAAIAIQFAIADPAATSSVALRVRCGVHAGAVERRDNDLFGSAVNRAARITHAAHGGQILLSQAIADLVHDRLPSTVSLRDLGSVRLRDLASPERVYQVLHPRLRYDFPALRSLESTPNNLPQQPTPFIGREHELAQVKQLLARTRFLSLLGMGGIGKTRLALQVAADVIESYPDGVWFADFAGIADSALVPNVVAQVLGVQEEAGKRIAQTLCAHLKSRRLMIVLDNCEHLIDACASLVDAMIRVAAEVRVLATSREALRIAGEQTYLLPALSLPNPGADRETLVQADSVQLFVERARARRPDFALSEQQAPAIAQICSRLDGIPLALELAAARVGFLTVEKIAERLDDRFRLLSGGSRTALPRQRTLRATIDWSYDLLSDFEAILFARLSVFVGGWTLEAAEHVGAGGGIANGEVLDVLASLVGKSLVVFDDSHDRYHMLDTIRRYALVRFQESGEEVAVRARHAEYFIGMVEQAEPALRRRVEEASWLQRLDLEHENVKLALDWGLQKQGSVHSAFRICGALGHFWSVRGHWRAARKWCSEALARDASEALTEARGKVLLTAGVMAFRLGEFVEAQALLQEALAVGRAVGNRLLEAGALNNLSNIVLDRGHFAEAQTLLQEAVAINRELGNDAWETINLGNLGFLFVSQGNFEAAKPLLARALALSRELGNRSLEAGALSNLGLLAQHQGNFREANALVSQALAMYRELGAPAQEVEQLQLLAEGAVACGDLAAAGSLFRQALMVSRELGYRGCMARCLNGMAEMAVEMGEFAEAVKLWGAGDALAEAIGVLVGPSDAARYDRARRQCRSALDPEIYNAQYDAGRTMSTETAIGAALGWLANCAKPAIGCGAGSANDQAHSWNGHKSCG
ncbi:MAG TPA: tetratricopeptide repeat protein [Casimicrobiaceae bacterium]|nr:tetratricopeptide repeat protein [Casimicrobiaceae bacterium]